MVAHRGHHVGQLLGRHAHLFEYRVGEHHRDLAVLLAAGDIAHVVQVPGDCSQLGLARVATEGIYDVVGAVGHDIRVAESVLGVADGIHVAVCAGYVLLDIFPALHFVQRDVLSHFPSFAGGTRRRTAGSGRRGSLLEYLP
jgi:hypothetical protein